MEKKIVKGQEQTHVKMEKKTDSGDFLPKKDVKPYTFTANKKVLHDRGDSRKLKNDGVHIKYDATKINKAVEVNAKSIKQSTSGVNKYGAQIKKNNSKFQSDGTDAEVNAKLKSNNNVNVKIEVKARNLSIVDGKDFKLDKGKLEKESRLQRSAGKSNQETRNETKDVDHSRAKVKEVINIPYMPEDELQQDTDETMFLKAERTKVKNQKPKAVTFKDRYERSPKFATRESKRPDSKTRWLKGTNSGKRRRRKEPSPSSAKTSINESLATEVVKWSPSSVNNHTKPYYEAWVDRSLTAFSKCSEKERLKLEKEIIETLEHFKRPVSPDLTYERINDEAYTGKIKVRRR